MSDPDEVERVAEALCDARDAGTAYGSLDATEKEWLRRMARWHLAALRAHRGAADASPPPPAWSGEAAEVESKARMFDYTLAALKSAHNRAMPFGQVMADLGLDQPPTKEPVFIRFRPIPPPGAAS